MSELKDEMILIGLHKIVKDLDHETMQIAGHYGLSFPQFMVLEALMHKDEMCIGDIKDTILSSNGTIPVIIQNLEKQGLLKRRKDQNDRRKSMISLTAQGRQIIEKIVPENTNMYHTRFQIWSEEEKRTLIHLLNRYRQLKETGDE
ncbi:MarR family winged helix-turn-helix transcriptional regulator [Intestinibaculum porci]|uniref:MarR family winged helix-turn-helix transcriptional regulator n=1 Tax=Intestinibaculum porci TaxID=2487118 RepID=UPI002409FF78|nr:transcriptional regulator [Intestinibaculum porci]MDD6350663.1 transcriptional regulator [Intestinibaculum porci]